MIQRASFSRKVIQLRILTKLPFSGSGKNLEQNLGNQNICSP